MAATLMARKPRTWAEYVRSAGASPREIATATGVSESIVSRWLSGKAHPSAENVVGFARAFGGRPVEALMSAGYLLPTEVEGSFEVQTSVTDLSDEDLLDELEARLAQRRISPVDTGASLADGPKPRKLASGGLPATKSARVRRTK